MGPQRPQRPCQPGGRWTAEGSDHRSIDGAVSGAIAGKTGPALPAISTASRVSRCTGDAVGPGASHCLECQPAASGQDREDRSVGCAGSPQKPHLCGPDAGYDRGQSAAVACQRDRAGPPCVLHSEAWRRSVVRRARFTDWAAISSSSRFNKTATSPFACTTGITSMRRQETRGNSKSITRLPVLILLRVRSVQPCRWWNQQRRWCARDSLLVNTFGYGACAEFLRLSSAYRALRGCWYALRAQEY